MKFPRLKNPLLCRIILYVVLIGIFIAPIIIAVNLKCISDNIKAIIIIACLIGMVIYLLKYGVILITVDMGLAMLHCYKTARKRFVLSDSFSVEKTEKRISRFGKGCESIKKYPRPKILRYKSSAPITIFSSGIEKIFAAYHIDYLDKSEYLSVVSSAKANSNSLKGKKKHPFLDKIKKNHQLIRQPLLLYLLIKLTKIFRMICIM